MSKTIATEKDSEGNIVKWKRCKCGMAYRKVTLDKGGLNVKCTRIYRPPVGTLMIFDEREMDRSME